MSTLTELIAEHRITATNPFATPRESDEAAMRMAKALEAVVDMIDEAFESAALQRASEYLYVDPRVARDAITAALTKGDGRG